MRAYATQEAPPSAENMKKHHCETSTHAIRRSVHNMLCHHGHARAQHATHHFMMLEGTVAESNITLVDQTVMTVVPAAHLSSTSTLTVFWLRATTDSAVTTSFIHVPAAQR